MSVTVSVNSSTLIPIIAFKAGISTDDLAKIIGCKDAKSVYNKKLNNAFRLGELSALLRHCEYELIVRGDSGPCEPVPIDSPEASPLLLSDFLKSVVLLNVTLLIYDRRYDIYSALDEVVKLSPFRRSHKNVILTSGSSTLICTDRREDRTVQLYKQGDVYFTLTIKDEKDVVTVITDREAETLLYAFRDKRHF